MAKRFTREELDNIIDDYKCGMTPKELGEKYGRNSSSIIGKLSSVGVYKKTTHRMTEDDIEFLRRYYPSGDYDAIFARFPKYTKANIAGICHKYGIKRENYKWSNEDIDILKKYYYKKSLDEIAEMIGYRHSCDAIQTKAYKIGYSKDRTWTDNELDILKTYYPIEDVDSVAKKLQNRTRDAIIRQANNMKIFGLRSNETWWTDEQVRLIVDNWETMNDDMLSNLVGRDVRAVKDKRLSLGFCRVKHFNEASYENIKKFLRGNTTEWKSESMKACDYCCVLTGDKDFQIHHLYSFHTIVDEVFEENNFDVRESFENYTPEELDDILEKFKQKQNEYPLGVCVRTDIHKEFHNKYGKTVTPDMWNEFVNDFNIDGYK